MKSSHLKLIKKAIVRTRSEILLLLGLGVLFNVIYSTLMTMTVTGTWV